MPIEKIKFALHIRPETQALVREVKQTNGSVAFKDAVRYQRGEA